MTQFVRLTKLDTTYYLNLADIQMVSIRNGQVKVYHRGEEDHFPFEEADAQELLKAIGHISSRSLNEIFGAVDRLDTEIKAAPPTIDDVLLGGKYVVLDTETTGLNDGEICQIAIINQDGDVLLDSLVRTVNPIPASATLIHGITNDMVADAPTFVDLVPQIENILKGQNVLVYNATYDRKMLHKSAEVSGIPKIQWKEISNWVCVMERFAELYGDYDAYRGSYRWQKLATAAVYFNIPQQQPAHTALADARTALAVAKAIKETFKNASNR